MGTRFTGVTTALLTATAAVVTMFGMHVVDAGREQVRVTAGNTPWPSAAAHQNAADNTPWPSPSVRAA
ncbi:hypothetical protein [Streptomyces sp. 11x1]|uniref:hypothetical protein n=1 Tax=unclassified Streptomyces TaxID=2593676 RepID=UPI00292CC5D0|nr:hypothetical protein [Streptomyces sp. 11x1]WNZ06251.1 hypothetical protein P8T65_00660 [Streptomyces sp. 11x1]